MANDTPASNTPPPIDVYISSKIPADNGYGQNGYRGASSDLPGKDTSTHFLPDQKASVAKAQASDWQTRSVDKNPLPTRDGMHAAASGAKIPDRLNYGGAPQARPVKK